MMRRFFARGCLVAFIASACGSTTGSHPLTPAPSSPSAPASPPVSGSASGSAKADRTTSPIGAPATQALWTLYAATLFVQIQVLDHSRPLAEEVRIVGPDGSLRSQAAVGPANAGEPVICGHPSIVPPVVAALSVPADVQRDFRQPGGPRSVRVEVREGSTWHPIDLLDALTLAEKPCAAPPFPPVNDGAAFYFPTGTVDFCGMFVSYESPTKDISGHLRLGGTTFVTSTTASVPYVQTVTAAPGTWSCVHGTIAFSETTPNVLTNFELVTAPDELVTTATTTACGAITALNVSDLPSGGSITLAGTTFDVGGVRRPGEGVEFDPMALHVGQNVCVAGASFVQRNARTLTALGGRVEVR